MYPALAAAEALARTHPGVSLHFVGSGGLEREIVRESGVAFATHDDVRGGPVVGVSVARQAVSAVQLAAGAAQAWRLLGLRRPGAVLLTGGWSSLPVALAAWARRVPVLIYLPDIEPGASIRLLQRFARRVALTVPESAAFFREGQTVVTGYPLRRAVTEATREAGQAHFALDAGRPTLLVFGGSRGARSLNRALLAAAPDLLADGVQIVHITGKLDWSEVEAARAALAAQGVDVRRYRAYPYLHREMGLALAAADLAVSRAGASVLGEFPLFGLPSVLVPYPHAWRYQRVNADYLASRGAALVLDDERLGDQLLPTVRGLLAAPDRLAEMRRRAAALAQLDGAARLALELVHLARETR
ncbi:MAG: UDP-N-acetylglucosamine--N-acetylmuramyl-(pentapeptide) pyrophosphoryl-undecaprenol N-acetylglucosamine transferase [Aggregatilineales bacterium]